MAKISLGKTIEAVKLNKRTGFPEAGPEVNIPFGALVEELAAERDTVKFSYLGEPYRCSQDLWESAMRAAGSAPPVPRPAAASPVSTVPAGPALAWQKVAGNQFNVSRAKVRGGWLVAVEGTGLVFVPDTSHEWDGGSPVE